MALAWLLRRPNVVVIPGASSVEQAEANAAAADLELTDDEDAALTAASDAYHPVRGTAALPALVRVRAERAVARLRRAVDGLGRSGPSARAGAVAGTAPVGWRTPSPARSRLRATCLGDPRSGRRGAGAAGGPPVDVGADDDEEAG